MKKTNLQRGFIPLIAIVIIAAVAVGGGAYYSKKKADKEAGPKEERMENKDRETKGKASIKALLSLNRNSRCTVSGTSSDGSTVSGVTYMSGSQMKGDFTMTASNGTKTESHMIRSGNDVYVWTGTTGAKMNISELESRSKAEANADKANVDINQDFDYECEDWDKVEATFAVPSSVNFVDVSAMMQNIQGKIEGSVKTDVNTKIKLGN